MSNVAAETVAAPVVSLQTDEKLSHEHSLALLHKLATDDDFRSRYEQKPAAALAELGVPMETIVNLKPACLASTKLAEKCHFAKAHRDLSNASVEECLQMILPTATRFRVAQLGLLPALAGDLHGPCQSIRGSSYGRFEIVARALACAVARACQ